MHTRECLLPNCDDWNHFIDSCYSLGCKDCGEHGQDGWTAINGKKVKFREWMASEHVRENTKNFSNTMTLNSGKIILF